MEELVRQVATLQKQVDGLIKPEIKDTSDLFLALPGLIGFWGMNVIERHTGNVFDTSGQARNLTYNGNPTYNIYNNQIAYIDLDGTGDALTRADETQLDILGTEAIFASTVRGVTLGGWFWFDSVAANAGLIGKFTPTGDQRSYALLLVAGGTARMAVSSAGTAATTVTVDSATLATGQWYFIVGRFVPSTELSIFVNSTEVLNTTSIPASVFNSTAIFEIGGFDGVANLLDGRASLCFLCANALPDAIISSLFQSTRAIFRI